jgi:triacylglycerol lipase
MKQTLLSFFASLLAAASSHARNPETLQLRDPGTAQLNPTRRVVLVHGFLETGSAFRMLKKRLEKLGVECLVPKLNPSDGRGGLEGLAERLKLDIDSAFGPEQPISIVAFSMGGVVSRHYLQNLGGASRCEKLFTISSPHHGTQAAWIYPSKGAEQMRPGSQFLADLEESQSRLGEMPVVSYRTPMDLIILPPVSSVWDRAVNLEYPVLLHPLMLTSNAVLADLERRLLE